MQAEERREQLLDATKAIVGAARLPRGLDRGGRARGRASRGRSSTATSTTCPGCSRRSSTARRRARSPSSSTVLPGDLGRGDPRETLLTALRGYLEAVRSDPETWRLVLMPPEGAPADPARPHRPRPRRGRRAARRAPSARASARAASRPTRSCSRARCPPSPTRARGCCSPIPEHYPVERIVGFARWLMDAGGHVSGVDPARLERLDRTSTATSTTAGSPGWLVVVARDGQVAHSATSGRRDVEAGLPVEPDTLWRIYSMTKPITSVAAMMLYEEGAFELKDPVSRWLPGVRRHARLPRRRRRRKPVTEPATRADPDAGTCSPTPPGSPTASTTPTRSTRMYRAARLRVGHAARHRPRRVLRRRGPQLPLLFQPGTEWNYGVSTDVLGRRRRGASPASRSTSSSPRAIFGPLGMVETRLLRVRTSRPRPARRALRARPRRPAARRAARRRWAPPTHAGPTFLSGGGGLVSTRGRLPPLHRACCCGGGELDGVRLLGPRTVRYMARNHLPGDADLESFGRPLFAETTLRRRRLRARLLGRRSTRSPTACCRARAASSPGAARPARRSGSTRSSDMTVAVLHPAAAVEHLSDPLAAAPAGPPGAGRLDRLPGIALALEPRRASWRA